jgi:hypothetical protein
MLIPQDKAGNFTEMSQELNTTLALVKKLGESPELVKEVAGHPPGLAY